MLSGKATNTNFIAVGLTRPGIEPTNYCTPGEQANHYATDALLMSWNRGAEYCTVTNPTHDVKPLCRMLYCTDSHTKQIRCAFNYTVTTHAQCGTILHKIVLSRLTHDFKALWRIVYCQSIHTMWMLFEKYCTVRTHTECQTVVQNIVLPWLTHNVKPLGNRLMYWLTPFLKALSIGMQWLTYIINL
jgi:hypothetical protein